MQENKAPSHVAEYQQEVFNFCKVVCLLWPGNSPDLNAIEPLWFWMKRRTTSHSSNDKLGVMKQKWKDCWEKEVTLELVCKFID